jgi:signal transduction histidine kinase
VERLERMIQRIDEYKGVLVSERKKGDINEVIKKAVDGAKDYMGDRDIVISTSLTEEPPGLNIDATNLKIAIFNILQNSVEAIEGRGEIRVSARPSGASMLLTISDTGCGMDEDYIRKIFHPFQTSKMTGAGLGLTVSYRIISDHGGEIGVTSKKGEGTTITIILPMEDKLKAEA